MRSWAWVSWGRVKYLRSKHQEDAQDALGAGGSQRCPLGLVRLREQPAVFGNASGCRQAIAEELPQIRACVLSPPKVTKQGAKMDAAPQGCLWLRGISSRATTAESSYGGSMHLIKTQFIGHLFARDDAPSHVSLTAPGRGGGA